MLNLPASTSQDDYIPLTGGLDLLTPTLRLPPGVLRDSLNFEAAVTGGYTRIEGYERTDGRPNPSDATYLALTANVTGTISVGNTITGVTSGATGVVVYRSGSLVVYTRSTGTFVLAETINVAAVAQGTVTDTGGSESAADFDVRMAALAADVYRADILAVPGSGMIRGVFYFNGVLFAMRNNAGATALVLYKATSGGWTLVAMPNVISFTAGTSEYTAGETLTQGGASATVLCVSLQSGAWAGTAAGRLFIGPVTGGPFAAGAAVGGGACTLSGAEAALVLSPGGIVETDSGTVEAARRVFGVDGVNKAWQFDGTTLATIVTNNTIDIPNRVMVHSGHLFLSFGNSVQHSGIGAPFTWTTLAGSGEMSADGDVTVMRRLAGDQSTGAAIIGYEEGSQALYGTTAATFNLVNYEDAAGMKAKSGQRMGQMFALDDRGVFSLAATQAFGNFASSTLTMNVRPWLQTRRNLVTGSVVNREKNQYRLFFSDGSGLYLTFDGRKMLGAMPVQFPDVVRCVCAGETPDGSETAFFGSDDGYVYRLDAGTSFDATAIDYSMTLVPANQKSPRQNKRYRKCTFEIQGESYAEFQVSFSLAYGSSERAQQSTDFDVLVTLQSAYWDSGSWDSFVWDGSNLAPSEVPIDGSGENIATLIRGSSAIFKSFTLNSEIITYSPRRRLR